jgi:hypothetical protein
LKFRGQVCKAFFSLPKTMAKGSKESEQNFSDEFCIARQLFSNVFGQVDFAPRAEM